MGVVVSAQLAGYLTAAVLGLAAGAVYDLLRVVRLRRRRNRRLTHALDGLFVAALALVSLWFALRVGQGELRLFMLSAMALGALVYALAGTLQELLRRHIVRHALAGLRVERKFVAVRRVFRDRFRHGKVLHRYTGGVSIRNNELPGAPAERARDAPVRPHAVRRGKVRRHVVVGLARFERQRVLAHDVPELREHFLCGVEKGGHFLFDVLVMLDLAARAVFVE